MAMPSAVTIELDLMERELHGFWDAMDRGWEPDSQDEVYYYHEMQFTKAFYKLCDCSNKSEHKLDMKFDSWQDSDCNIPWVDF